jgi:LemA protein
MTFYISLSIFVVLVLFIVLVYNRLVSLRNLAREAWSGIDVQLKKRHELIPRLVDVVKGYASHEQNLLTHITELRNLATKENDLKAQEKVQIGIAQDLGKLFVIVENYPELKANENFAQLQIEISKVEHDLQRARRYYNGSVRDLNTKIQQFPSNIIASIFKFEDEPFFDIQNESERAVPQM